MIPPASHPRTASTLPLRTCLIIATIFWAYVSLTTMARWELMRQAAHGVGIARPELIALACLLLFPPLWLLTVVSWRFGYDLKRWPALLAVNLGLALLFGLCARPSLILSAALLRGVPLLEAKTMMDGTDPFIILRRWGASSIEDAAQYLVLQSILTGAAFYARLKAEQALRERFAAEYDRAKLQVLRMQTNPHFLFNTLSAIAGLIRARPEAAEAMVARLGELFRATLVDRDAELVTLQRELALGEQYLEIQRARFDQRFDYHIAAAGNVGNALVPPLLLQPLLENAAEHGLTSHEGTIEVDVSCEMEENRVRVTVSNRSDASRRGKSQTRGGGFGLENVRARLRAAFGEAASLTAEHTKAGFFEARLEFPARVTG